MTIIFDVIMIAVVFVFCTWTGIYAFKSRCENHYNTDMREHYNEHYFKQLVKQSGVKNSPEYSPMTAPTIDNEQLPSTGHWEDW